MTRRFAHLLILLALLAGPRMARLGILAQPSGPTAPPTVTPIAPSEHNLLFRPIQPGDGLAHLAERTYPYGSTQNGRRAVHLGVEFVNRRGTPIHASLAGKIVFAGKDDKMRLGPKLNYYGKAVIIAHTVESLAGERIFTLYGHLESLAVVVGQQVSSLELIGHVGSSGVAIGAHLHYEVRANAPFDYRATRNPALWLRHTDGRGLLMGAVQDAHGEFMYGKRLTLRNHKRTREVYTYASPLVNPDAVWGENFTVSDLPAGEYELAVLSDTGGIAYREMVTVAPLGATFVTVALD
ncbi:MAG: M23 family metallopeptidase [Chloroflexi bacterium]|nr:M23 family metallopeptidase [Chloroflexota bacterium]MCY4246594.1 M23 family metallopeptidase [Chloroflexota bacterium]